MSNYVPPQQHPTYSRNIFYITKNKRDILVIKLGRTPRIVLHKINRNDDTLNKLYCTLFENY